MLLEGKIAIVTGSGQGLGKAMAFNFAQEGAVPVIIDIDEEKGQKVAEEIRKKYDVDPTFIKTDVSNVTALKQMVKKVVNKYDTVDILVNNAGILHSTPIDEITEVEWDKIMSVNLKSVFFASQEVLPYMRKQGKGRIINISSLAGRMGGYKNGLAYSASKAGIIGVTQGMASRVADDNITVNAVAPGTTATDIIKQFSEEKIQDLESSIPLKRLGKPEDIANTVSFLASDQAGFITGAVIDVNGGMYMG